MSDNNKIMHMMLGAKAFSGIDRDPHDYYATSPKALELIIDELDLAENVWECACGGGHLSKVLEKHGHNVKSTDLYFNGYGRGGIDFLQQTEKYNGDILTNPPYKYAKEFVEKALELTDGKVVMLLKITFLEGKARRKLFAECPPKYVYVSSSRLQCAKNGDFDTYTNGTALCFCWFVWEKGFVGEPIIRWFN